MRELGEEKSKFLDEVQLVLQVLLHEFAVEGGLAYLLRKAEYFPGTYFPVASSWAPQPVPGESDLSRHLSNYHSFPYVFARNADRFQTETMPSDLVELSTKWPLESLYLGHRELPLTLKDGRIEVNGDPWIRSRIGFGDPQVSPSTYQLVVGGPAGPRPIRRFTQEALATFLLGDTWLRVARGWLRGARDAEEVAHLLRESFEDNSVAPPYWNSPVFSVEVGGKQVFGLNRLAFSCYLAWRKQNLVEICEQSGVPDPDRLAQVITNPNLLTDLDLEWQVAIAQTPHLAMMLQKARGNLTHYFQGGDAIADASSALLSELGGEVRPSEVLNLLRLCTDHMSRIDWSPQGDQWVFWIRANHVTEGLDGTDHEKISALDLPPNLTSVEVFSELWRRAEPKRCDLMNALWAVRLAEGRPDLIFPLFLRFHEDGRERIRQMLMGPDRKPLGEQSNSVVESEITYRLWSENVQSVRREDQEAQFEVIRRNAVDLLREATLSPAFSEHAEERLLRYSERVLPHSLDRSHGDDDCLGHDWLDTSTVRIRFIKYLERYFRLEISEASEQVPGFYKAVRQIHLSADGSRRELEVSPLAVLLADRLVDLSGTRGTSKAAEQWLVELLTAGQEEYEEIAAPANIGRPSERPIWWYYLTRFLRTIRWNKDKTNLRTYRFFELAGRENGCFEMRLALHDFNVRRFEDAVLGGAGGNATSHFMELLGSLGQEASEAFGAASAACKGMRVAVVSEAGNTALRIRVAKV